MAKHVMDREHQATLFDLIPPHVRGSDTSLAAAESMVGMTGRLRLQILNFIRQVGTATCDECEVRLDMRHQTCSARICELKVSGLIVDTGERRVTRSGRSAAVYTTGLTRSRVSWCGVE